MTVRGILYILAVLLVMLGASQLVFASWWIGITPGLLGSSYLFAFGLIAIFFGGVLLIAAARRIIGLRAFVVVLGLLLLVSGIFILFNPRFMQDLIFAMYFNRSYGFRKFLTLASGIIRVVIGAAIFYALSKVPAREQSSAV